MRRKQDAVANAPGQDCFMDVVTNLVGILIVLVTVVGVVAKDALLDVAHPTVEETTLPAPDVAGAATAAASVEGDIHRLATTMSRQQLEIAFRREERDRVHLLVTAAQEKMAVHRDKLDAEQQVEFDNQRALIAARRELEELQRGRQALQNSAPATAVIEHLPTPMAKTVFGREIHFRLAGGRLTPVPWDELVEQLKRDAPNKAWRLKDEPQFTETLGPIGGFWLHYTLKRAEYTLPTKHGVAVQSRVELDRFVVVPVSEDLGEPLEKALTSGSQFLSVLEQHRPAETTVTVWVYPDSFGQFRSVKQVLYSRGYLTASRPLPAGHPIGGSPQGSRSAAE